ncbi:MAG: Lysylphosphatidylglycerol synthetase/glycosyltransferase AglD [Gemmatimonadetes bacterium]|nr:Lysylphosphatidylglycerol synthetase/glycosyltransferase AglD [Gemmatimonadota bacterium]
MKKFGWKGALGLVISAVCLYFAFRNFQWAQAVQLAKHANYGLLLLATVASTGMFPLRARRWRTILDPVAPNVPFGPLWRATAIGVMLTNILPARAGEVARPIALAREVPAVPFSMGLASVVVDRVFDAMVVLLLLAVAMLSPDFPAGAQILGQPISHFARAFAIVPLAALIVSYALVFFPDRLIRLFELIARRVHPVVEAKGSEMLRRFADGLGVLRNPRHFVAVFVWTLLHWLLQPLAFWLGFRAFGIAVPWEATLFVQGVIVILVSVPSTPGFVGVFEAGGVAALGVFGIDQTAAGTWALVFHIISAIPITLIGAYYFARAGLTMGDLGSAAGDKSA